MQLIGVAILGMTCSVVMDAETLIRGHEQHLGRIFSLRMSVAIRSSQDGGAHWTLLSTTQLRRSGSKTRSHVATENFLSQGQTIEARGFRDFRFDDRQTLSIAGPEGFAEGPLDYGLMELEHGRVSGRIDFSRVVGPFGYGDEWALPALIVPNARYPMRSLWEAAGKSQTSPKHDTATGKLTYELKLRTPDTAQEIIATLDPEHDFALSGLKILDAKGKPFEMFGDMNVTDFQEPKPGIFLPKLARGESSRAQLPKQIFEFSTSDVVVNEPIDEKEFNLRFPRGCDILDVTKDNTIYIWGDGKPEISFATVREFNDWAKSQVASAARRRQPWWQSKAVAFLGSLLILISGLVVYRRHRARSN